MKVIFIAISAVVIYKDILDNVIFHESEKTMLLLDMLRNIGNITLILILCLSIRDTIRNMKEQERISKKLAGAGGSKQALLHNQVTATGTKKSVAHSNKTSQLFDGNSILKFENDSENSFIDQSKVLHRIMNEENQITLNATQRHLQAMGENSMKYPYIFKQLPP